ncbi:hypothetical protein BESB_066640 [Besnoitia besnoiti]|uniref:Uncharacterized protein n=1 Tax=Besnoitia besnoiti TaxID=94643 RepID=A0A2A9MED3_BESBE|nr:hypothetical protein BESB_066640 [Besnoitia besnoiti]PFH34631.1 hypothetical protein BESB_066640 [Besnoitia besnoiti]
MTALARGEVKATPANGQHQKAMKRKGKRRQTEEDSRECDGGHKLEAKKRPTKSVKKRRQGRSAAAEKASSAGASRSACAGAGSRSREASSQRLTRDKAKTRDIMAQRKRDRGEKKLKKGVKASPSALRAPAGKKGKKPRQPAASSGAEAVVGVQQAFSSALAALKKRGRKHKGAREKVIALRRRKRDLKKGAARSGLATAAEKSGKTRRCGRKKPGRKPKLERPETLKGKHRGRAEMGATLSSLSSSSSSSASPLPVPRHPFPRVPTTCPGVPKRSKKASHDDRGRDAQGHIARPPLSPLDALRPDLPAQQLRRVASPPFPPCDSPLLSPPLASPSRAPSPLGSPSSFLGFLTSLKKRQQPPQQRVKRGYVRRSLSAAFSARVHEQDGSSRRLAELVARNSPAGAPDEARTQGDEQVRTASAEGDGKRHARPSESGSAPATPPPSGEFSKVTGAEAVHEAREGKRKREVEERDDGGGGGGKKQRAQTAGRLGSEGDESEGASARAQEETESRVERARKENLALWKQGQAVLAKTKPSPLFSALPSYRLLWSSAAGGRQGQQREAMKGVTSQSATEGVKREGEKEAVKPSGGSSGGNAKEGREKPRARRLSDAQADKCGDAAVERRGSAADAQDSVASRRPLRQCRVLAACSSSASSSSSSGSSSSASSSSSLAAASARGPASPPASAASPSPSARSGESSSVSRGHPRRSARLNPGATSSAPPCGAADADEKPSKPPAAPPEGGGKPRASPSGAPVAEFYSGPLQPACAASKSSSDLPVSSVSSPASPASTASSTLSLDAAAAPPSRPSSNFRYCAPYIRSLARRAGWERVPPSLLLLFVEDVGASLSSGLWRRRRMRGAGRGDAAGGDAAGGDAAGGDAAGGEGVASDGRGGGFAAFGKRRTEKRRLGEVERLLQVQNEWARAKAVSLWRRARSQGAVEGESFKDIRTRLRGQFVRRAGWMAAAYEES